MDLSIFFFSWAITLHLENLKIAISDSNIFEKHSGKEFNEFSLMYLSDFIEFYREELVNLFETDSFKCHNNEDSYEISSLGRIKSKQRLVKDKNGNYTKTLKEKILLSSNNGKGYLVLNLYKDGKRKQFLIHRLMAFSFLNYKPISSHETVIDHKDNNPFNNSLNNLQIITNRLKLNVNYFLVQLQNVF